MPSVLSSFLVLSDQHADKNFTTGSFVMFLLVKLWRVDYAMRRVCDELTMWWHDRVCVCVSPVGTGTFRAQDLSFPRTNSPYGELSFPRLFVPGNFRSRGTKVSGNFRSMDLSFRGTFVLRTFRSHELSFLRLFYTALAMNRRQL